MPAHLSPSWGRGHTACPRPLRTNSSTRYMWSACPQEDGYTRILHSDAPSTDLGRRQFLLFVLKERHSSMTIALLFCYSYFINMVVEPSDENSFHPFLRGTSKNNSECSLVLPQIKPVSFSWARHSIWWNSTSPSCSSHTLPARFPSIT